MFPDPKRVATRQRPKPLRRRTEDLPPGARGRRIAATGKAFGAFPRRR